MFFRKKDWQRENDLKKRTDNDKCSSEQKSTNFHAKKENKEIETGKRNRCVRRKRIMRSYSCIPYKGGHDADKFR
jgi:hypothetical protein